jgi:hypothetical protein
MAPVDDHQENRRLREEIEQLKSQLQRALNGQAVREQDIQIQINANTDASTQPEAVPLTQA